MHTKGKKNITMKDVAQRAGVSISTVSHVINETRYVENETREKIVYAIAELGYKPNIIARSLRGKGTKTIGVIISDIRDTFFSDSIKAIEANAKKNGYNVMLCDAEGSIDEENAYIEILLRKGVDGLIIAPVDMYKSMYHPKNDYPHSTIPVVQIDRKISGFEADFVGIDNAEGARIATIHLFDHGFESIGFVGYENRFYSMKKRMEGYSEAVRARGSTERILIAPRGKRGESIKDEVIKWLSSEDLDAVLCGNDDICFGVLSALYDLRLRIPEDIGLITFDDVKWFPFLQYPITVIRQPAYLIGETAMDLLAKRMKSHEYVPVRDILLDTELIVRKSCGEY
jgi:LacI family transcriptional regulator